MSGQPAILAFEDLPHDNRSSDTILAVVLCMILATAAVCLRLYTRHFVLRRLWIDDYLAFAGMIGMITNGILQCVQTKYGLGAHYYDMTDEAEAIEFFKVFYAVTISYNTTLMFIKFSLFFQYYRLIQEVPYYRLFYIGIMAIVGGWVISQEFILIFSCTPIRAYWDRSAGGHCLDGNLIGWMNSVGNIVTDVIVLLLPIPVVWRLNLKRGKRWAVMGVFTLGFFTCIISICRLVFFARLTIDFSYDLVAVAAWGEAESASGLICSSLICLAPLVRRISHHFQSTKKESLTPPKKYLPGSNPFSRHTRDKSGALKTNGSRNIFGIGADGSETELNCLDGERSRKTETQDDGRSLQSDSDAMPDFRLGLETGIRTIISTGNRDSIQSPSLPPDSQGIIVKQVWSIRNKDSSEKEDQKYP